MSKPAKTTKPIKAKDKFTPREVGSLIEQFRGEFRIFGEDLATVKSDLKSTKEMVGRNFERITLLEIAVRNIAAKVEKNTEAIAALTQKVDKNTEAITLLSKRIEELTQSIDNLAKTKSDQQDLQALERRLSQLEAKVAALAK